MPGKPRKAAMPKSGAGGLKVRPLGAGDLDAIVAIDRAVSGRSRRGFYERRLAQLGRDPSAFVALGAEGEGLRHRARCEAAVGGELLRIADPRGGGGQARRRNLRKGARRSWVGIA